MKLISLLFVLMSFNVLASEWKLVNQSSQVETSQVRIKFLTDTHPAILQRSGVNLKDIRQLEITLQNYIYIGQTTCSENDPRLKIELLSFEICFQDLYSACLGLTEGTPYSQDPCMN